MPVPTCETSVMSISAGTRLKKENVSCFLYLCLGLSHKCGPGFSKTRRQRLQEHHKTQGFISSAMAVHVRDKSSYISLPSSAKQQREMTMSLLLKLLVKLPTSQPSNNPGLFLIIVFISKLFSCFCKGVKE